MSERQVNVLAAPLLELSDTVFGLDRIAQYDIAKIANTRASPTPLERAESADEQRYLVSVMRDAGLTHRDRNVLQMHFGLCGQEPQTLGQIAAQFRLSKGYVRELRDRAIDTLRGYVMRSDVRL